MNAESVGTRNGVFAALDAPDDDTARRRLHDRLVAAADSDGMLDVAYRTIGSPIGTLLLAATEQGLVKVAFQRGGQEDVDGHHQALLELAEKVSPRILHAPGRLDLAARQLDEYFSGVRRSFEVPLDFRLSGGFRRQALTHIAEIAYGHTQSYTEIAAATGSPRAVRAVGTACATNPLPILVPCHRVLRSDGSVGGYGGGIEAKQLLLQLEAA